MFPCWTPLARSSSSVSFAFDLMRTLAVIAALIGVGLLAQAQQNRKAASQPSWKLQPPISGRYVPNPSRSLYAGELIRIDGTNFHYTRFTDVDDARVPDYRAESFFSRTTSFWTIRASPIPTAFRDY